MRRAIVAFIVLTSACAHMSWEGDRTLSRDVSAQPDTLLVAAAQALRDHGYDARIINNTTIVTAPKLVPQYQRPVSTAGDTLANSWFVEVRVAPNQLRSGSRLQLAAYLVPRVSEMPVDTLTKRPAIPVTSGQPTLFTEVERIGNWIVESAANRRTP
jgi:hypothetical protein